MLGQTVFHALSDLDRSPRAEPGPANDRAQRHSGRRTGSARHLERHSAMTRRLRRRRRPRVNDGRLADEDDEPITFATPGEPTLEERRRYALAVQRAMAPPALSPAQQAEVSAIHQMRRELFPYLYS